MRRIDFAVLLPGLLLACGPQELVVPAVSVPTDSTARPTDVPLEPSYISAPIIFDYRPLLRELEEDIPRRIGSTDKERRIDVGGSPRTWVAAEAWRGPLDVRFDSNTVTASTVFEYRARAWVRPLLVEQSVSCGMGDVRPRLAVTVTTTFEVTSDWRLQTRTRLASLRPVTEGERDQCEVTFLRLNVTGKVVDGASTALRRGLRRADRTVARVDLREALAGIWHDVQQPIRLVEDHLWLELQPEGLSIGPFTATDSTLEARLDMLATPRIVSGPRPEPHVRELPPLGQGSALTDTALIHLEGVLDYGTATSLLSEALAGRSFFSGWRRVRIDGVTVGPAGGGKILLALRVGGRARGTVYVTGTPVYDPATDLVTIPDLDFEVSSRSYLMQAAGWLARGRFLEVIREHGRIPATRLLNEAVRLANQELDRELSDGVRLRGRIGDAQAMDVVPTSEGLVARARAAGTLQLLIAKEQLVPAQPIRRAVRPPR